ncbi:GNAT family N-acetyltransferase [uncultured Roseibium sp.]|uniref:GNAT family N-acetyltransferase n=1 Tax=uncultured Roseibium sp. TaxID=1936171 RepID=UPI003217CDE0
MIPEIRIEKARPEHLAEILALLIAGAAGARVGQETRKVEDYRDAFEAMLAAPEMDVYVALDGDEVVGTYQIHFMKGLAFQGRSRVELESVHTREGRRGQGIGARMMAHAEELARAANAGLIQLTSNRVRTDVHRFYERLGFNQSHLGFKKML